jgi:outer membrane protein TolC
MRPEEKSKRVGVALTALTLAALMAVAGTARLTAQQEAGQGSIGQEPAAQPQESVQPLGSTQHREFTAQDTITLEEAVRRALARSPAIREAEGERRAATAGRWESWGRLVPALSFTTGFNQSQILQRSATDPVTGGIVQLPDSLILDRETFGTQAVLSADWTVFDGETYWEIRRANAEARAGDLAYQAARARVAADVKIAYLDALEAVALESFRRADLERLRGLAEVAGARFRVGEVPELDDLQARLAASDAEIALLETESETDNARLALFEHLALPPSAEVALIEPVTPEPSELPTEEELRRRAMQESYELAALREEREAADRGLSAEKWWFLPTVTLGAAWVRSEFGQTRDALTLEPTNEQTLYRLGITWSPLEQPGGLIAERRRARGALWSAEGRLAARQGSLAREVEVALNRFSRARTLQEASRLNLDLAQRQREQASERYRLGLGTIVERLNADALAAEAEQQAIAARYATLRAIAELERAAGIRVIPGGGETPPR